MSADEPLSAAEQAMTDLFASAMGRRGEWPEAKVLTDDEIAERVATLAPAVPETATALSPCELDDPNVGCMCICHGPQGLTSACSSCAGSATGDKR